MDRRQKPRRNPHMVLGSYIGVTLPAPHLSEPLHGSAPEVAQEAPRIAPLPGVRGLAVRPKHAPVNALRRVGGEVWINTPLHMHRGGHGVEDPCGASTKAGLDSTVNQGPLRVGFGSDLFCCVGGTIAVV